MYLSHRPPSSGFTLLEMVVVIVVLGIAASIVVTNLPAQPQRLDAVALDIASAVRFARDEAIRTEEAYGIDIDLGNQVLRVFRGDTSTNPVTANFDVYHPINKQLYTIDLGSSYSGVTLSAASTWATSCSLPTRIGFNGDRVPRCGEEWGAILLTGTLTVSDANLSKGVVIGGTTGRVTLGDTL